MRLRAIMVALASSAGLASTAQAADKVIYGPPETWVQPAAIPQANSIPDSGAAQMLLQDDQMHFGQDADVFYSERAIRIRTPQALASGNFIVSWNPETESLIVHKLHVIRDGKVIDVLEGGKTLTVLRRETNLEAATLDGALTATIQPEDLRVGDIVDYALSIRRHDPIRRGFSEGFGDVASYAGVAGRTRIRAVWDAPKSIRWRVTAGLNAPRVMAKDGHTEMVVDREKASAPKRPAKAPLRFRQVGELEFSQFRDWAELAGVMAPLFEEAATLTPSSPIKAEAAKIKAGYPDARQRAAAALKLVQEQTRYVFLGMNLGGYKPASADETWRRRFGDCKGKTALLLALLHELGVSAEPAFVSSGGGDGLDQRLPMLGVFDHVLVRAQIDGKTYWLDGTRLGDRTLEDIEPPDFHWALPLRRTGAELVAIQRPPYAQPQQEKLVRIEIKSGLDVSAHAHIESLFRGDMGIAVHLAVDNLSGSDVDRYLRQFWSQQYPWIKASAVGEAYDPKSGLMRLWLDGDGPLEWNRSGPYKDFQVIDSGAGGDPDYNREDGPNKDAPFAVAFPNYNRREVTVVLPQKGVGFTLFNKGDVKTTIAGVSYMRTALLKDGVVQVVSEERSLAPEFPYVDADKASADLRKLAYDNLFIRALAPSSTAEDTASGAIPAGPSASAPPSAAAELANQGSLALRRHDYDEAIKDYTQASIQTPGFANYIYNRGVAHYQKGEDDLALADFGAALKIDPQNSLVLAARAELQLYRGKLAEAQKDYDAALRTRDRKDILWRRAASYRDTDHLDLALKDYSDWLGAYPNDRDAPGVRSELCLTRALLGREPDAVLGECQEALKVSPNSNEAKDGLAISLLRLSRADEATKAFNAALRFDSGNSLMLYGRGLARMRAGDTKGGDADLKLAVAKELDVAKRYKLYRLAP